MSVDCGMANSTGEGRFRIIGDAPSRMSGKVPHRAGRNALKLSNRILFPEPG